MIFKGLLISRVYLINFHYFFSPFQKEWCLIICLPFPLSSAFWKHIMGLRNDTRYIIVHSRWQLNHVYYYSYRGYYKRYTYTHSANYYFHEVLWSSWSVWLRIQFCGKFSFLTSYWFENSATSWSNWYIACHDLLFCGCILPLKLTDGK